VSPDTIWLLRYPISLGSSVEEHVQEWMREFTLIRLGQLAGTATHDVPARLQQMVEHLTREYAGELAEPDRLRAAAAAQGEAYVDLPYPVRPETEQVVVAWQQMLDEVDEFCRAEDLLTLQRSPAQKALNDWVLQEFLRQLQGAPPQPWSPITGIASAS
jgi:phytoene dehydrogenase-like protein